MKLTDVAIVAVEGFSPFHYAVPLHAVWRFGFGNQTL